MTATPGPWRANGTRVETTMESHRAVWTIVDCAGGDDGVMSRREAEANALLIAGAPTLLAACREYLDWCASVTEGAPDLKPLRERMRAAVEMMGG